VTFFAAENWRDVTVDLWGNLQADVKMPVLLALVFLLGFLPTWLVFRGRLWRLNSRVSIAGRDIKPEPPVDEPEQVD
jgi:uncharacterized membrane protein YciS (DUF1049 family)